MVGPLMLFKTTLEKTLCEYSVWQSMIARALLYASSGELAVTSIIRMFVLLGDWMLT